MTEENKKIRLPDKTQIEITKFFLRTSVPRILREQEAKEKETGQAKEQSQSENNIR